MYTLCVCGGGEGGRKGAFRVTNRKLQGVHEGVSINSELCHAY